MGIWADTLGGGLCHGGAPASVPTCAAPSSVAPTSQSEHSEQDSPIAGICVMSELNVSTSTTARMLEARRGVCEW